MKSQTLFVLFASMVLIMTGCTPPEEKRLIELIKDGNSESAIEMINNGADVNARDSIQRTPLHAAARQSNIEVMELLISKGADLEARVVGTQDTPLFDAVMGGSKEAVQLLLDKGANVNAKTPAGETAAAYATDPAIAELLGKTVDAME